MPTAVDVFLFLFLQYWWAFLSFALFVFLFMMQAARTVVNTVLYIRRGKTLEYKRCSIRGTNIIFKANPRQPPVAVHINAEPYIFVKGLSTKRLYVVTEGSGETSRFPMSRVKGELANTDLIGVVNPMTMAATASLSYFERFTENLTEHLPKGKSEYLTMILYVLIGAMIGLAWGMLIGRGAI